ncbi:uncharacterized protein QC761_0015530 [Podospora bellae-mahoneyi]|uniref:FAD-binding PCMH-type domain-containing protein n=1 Tax=Podospora bellae-mahoneyi TaxID=2093777 RepID=A0ABR0FZI6_9PEZI|nr:hypothetical protein QC761_0015530 [Podospora bellae-mahoneyi]
MIPTGLGVGLSSLLLCSGTASALVWNTFDGPGSPACHNVSRVHDATSVEDMQSVVKSAILSKSLVRAAGKGHMWYDTQCSDDSTIIIKTAIVAGIYDFSLPEGAPHGSVLVDAGVTFFQLAEYLHDRGASVGYTLTNWNISFGGSVVMGAHRSSIREDSMVAAERNESDDDWLAASTSLGLLGIIARIKLKIYPDSKVYAKQNTEFHQRYYDVVPANFTEQQGFQNTFCVTDLEAFAAKNFLNSRKYLPTSNMLMEEIFFGQWEKPDFREKTTSKAIDK